MKSLGVLFGLAILIASAPAEAAPESISFAGRLSTASGPVSGSQSITFKIFDAATAGTQEWTDTLTLNADNGLVFATLGTTANPLDESVFSGATLYLEITVGAEVLSPRLPINAVPYAVSATNADLLGGSVAASDVVQTVNAGAGLMGGGAPVSGAVTLSVDATTIVTGVTAGTGLSGGGSGGDVTLSVNTAVIQARVTSVCAAGQSIRAIAADGTVTCEVDDVGLTVEGDAVVGNEVVDATNTSLTRSGLGTAASPYTLAVNTTVIQGRVTGSCVAGQSIRAIAQDGTVTCEVDDGGANTDGIEFIAPANSSDPDGVDNTWATINMSWPSAGYILVTWDYQVSCPNVGDSIYTTAQLVTPAQSSSSWTSQFPGGTWGRFGSSHVFAVTAAGTSDINIRGPIDVDCTYMRVNTLSAIFFANRL